MRAPPTVLALALILALTPAVVGAASCPAPPSGFGSSWWSSYKAWCRSCGGQICDYYNDCQGTCSLPASAGTASGLTPGEELGQALGKIMACKVFGQGCPTVPEDPDARAAYYRLSAEQKQRLAAADAAQSAADEAARQRVNSVLAGGSVGGLALRDLDIKQDLTTQTVAAPMGTTTVVPYSVVPRPDVTFHTKQYTALEQLDCAEQLVKRASDLSSDFDQETRSDLAGEAVNYLEGAPAHIHCLTTPGYALKGGTLAARRAQQLVDARYFELLMHTYGGRAEVNRALDELLAQRMAGATGLEPAIARREAELAAIDQRLAALARGREAALLDPGKVDALLGPRP